MIAQVSKQLHRLKPSASVFFSPENDKNIVIVPKLNEWLHMKSEEILTTAHSRKDQSAFVIPPAFRSEGASSLVALVAEQPFFNGLNERQFQLLAESAMVTQFEAGQWIFRQGDPANRFYLILEGTVLIESEVKDRGMIPIRTLGPGDNLAWAWLFPPYYMHFSACAVERTRALFFYATRLREQCDANHELGYQLMKRIAEIVVQNLNATQQRLLECTGTAESFTLPR